MYLNLVQITESFGVTEKVVQDWIRTEGMPHLQERGRLLFDRAQVTEWAADHGLGATTGFLAPATPAFTTGWRMEPLLAVGGIWRDVAAAQMSETFAQVVGNLPGAAPAVRQMVAQRLRAPNGITLAPVGGGFALPHPSARIALGRDAGTVALVLLRDALPESDAPDGVPINRLFFFLAPSPRAHLDLLGRLSRMLSRGPLRELIVSAAPDAAILDAVALADNALASPPAKEGPA